MDKKERKDIIFFLQNKVRFCRILVVGDVMLDRYFYGSVDRISPEAPVPITLIHKTIDTLGGAANVAHNLARLGCQTSLVGVIGSDYHGRLLRRKMRSIGIDYQGILICRKSTTTKVRVLGGHQQMLRMDFEENDFLSADDEELLADCVRKKLTDGVDSVILSDYHKGICSDAFCQYVIKLAHEYNVPLLVDPKGSNWEKYRGADFITPNVKETGEAFRSEVHNEDADLRNVANFIRNKFAIGNVVITRSEKGISLFLKDQEFHIPTFALEVFDVSGAGDTVIAALTAGMAGDLSVESAAIMANFAAGIGVGKVRTYAVSRAEILNCIRNFNSKT